MKHFICCLSIFKICFYFEWGELISVPFSSGQQQQRNHLLAYFWGLPLSQGQQKVSPAFTSVCPSS